MMIKRQFTICHLIIKLFCLGLFLSQSGLVDAAPPVRQEILDDYNIVKTQDGYDITIQFTIPVIYQTHFPRKQSDEIYISVVPVTINGHNRYTMRLRDSLVVKPDKNVPLTYITFDGELGFSPYLLLEFSKDVVFNVRQGRDFRSIVVTVLKDNNKQEKKSIEH